MNGLNAIDVKYFELFKGFSDEELPWNHRTIGHRNFVNFDDVLIRIQVSTLSADLNAGEIDADFIVKPMTKERNHFVQKSSAILFVVDDGGNAIAHLQDNGRGNDQGNIPL